MAFARITRIANILGEAGHDVVHVFDIGRADATDVGRASSGWRGLESTPPLVRGPLVIGDADERCGFAVLDGGDELGDGEHLAGLAQQLGVVAG